jgi:hypothetical protein
LVFGYMNERKGHFRKSQEIEISVMATVCGSLQPQLVEKTTRVWVSVGDESALTHLPDVQRYPVPVLAVLERRKDGVVQISPWLLNYMPQGLALVVVKKFDADQVSEILERVRAGQGKRRAIMPPITTFQARTEEFWTSHSLIVAKVEAVEGRQVSLKVLKTIAGEIDTKTPALIDAENDYLRADDGDPFPEVGKYAIVLLSADELGNRSVPEAAVVFLPTNCAVVPIDGPTDEKIDEVAKQIQTLRGG